MYNFSPLHNRTDHSVMQSTISIDKLIQIAKESKFGYLVISDLNVLSGVPEFVNKCQKNNIKPVVGMDLDIDGYRFTLLAKNHEGFRHLAFLSSKINNLGEVITLENVKDENVFIIDNPHKGYFARTKRQLNLKNYFVGTTEEHIANAVYFTENKIIENSDRETLKILNFLNPDKNNLVDLNKVSPYPQNVNLKDFRVQQAVEIASNCNVVFPKDNPNFLPVYKNDEIENNANLLVKIIATNAKTLLKRETLETQQIYKRRIEKELKIIKNLGFIDYFLIIQDAVKWAKNQQIKVGPGRGSAVGSLVSYLLGITSVDPLKYGLIFERFLNPERVNLPDIDVDIQDDRRDEVINYLFEKYGKDKTALISTVAKFGPKTSLRDAGRFLETNQWEVDAICKTLKSGESLETSYKSNSHFAALINKSLKNKRLFQQAVKLESLVRQRGTHAAGVVISNLELGSNVPLTKGQKNLPQLQYPMDYLEQYQLLKIDFLGLKNLKLLSQMEKYIAQMEGNSFDLSKIALDDPQTNSLLSGGQTRGVFQLESPGMQKTLRKIGVTSLLELTDVISMFRPGPINHIENYYRAKNHLVETKSVSPEYDQIVAKTNGIIIYQEQIMEIAQKVARLTLGQADLLRRSISKKNASNIEKLKERFVQQAVNNKYRRETATKIYDQIAKFANYGFNKSHGIAYATIAYQMAFVKARFPLAFYATLINDSVSAKGSLKEYINEAKTKNIKIVGPNINVSKLETHVDLKNNTLVLPLQLVSGVNKQTHALITHEKQKGGFKDFYDFVVRMKKNNLSDEVILALVESGSLKTFGNTETLLASLPGGLKYSKMVIVENGSESKEIDFSILPKLNLVQEKRNVREEVKHDLKYFNCRVNAFETTPFEKAVKINNIGFSAFQSLTVLLKSFHVGRTQNDNSYVSLEIEDSSCQVKAFAYGEIVNQIQNLQTPLLVNVTLRKKMYNNQETFTISQIKSKEKETNE